MTQPAVHGQFQQNAPQDSTRPPARGSRPAASSGTPAEPRIRGGAWRTAAVIAGAGVPVGLLWWLLAPAGLNLLSGNPELRNGGNTEGWLPRDLVLAGLFLLAGCISGGVASGSKHRELAGRDVLLVVGAGAAGALAAWGTGVLCGLWWAAPEDPSASASIAFSLRSLAVLAIWPAAAALTIFLNTVFATPESAGGPESGE
ncbi:MAG: hypothetical protein ABWX85_04135 [Arthrobacter sp.]